MQNIAKACGNTFGLMQGNAPEISGGLLIALPREQVKSVLTGGCKLAAVLQIASQVLMFEKVLETNKFSQYSHNFDNIFESFMIFTIKYLQL